MNPNSFDHVSPGRARESGRVHGVTDSQGDHFSGYNLGMIPYISYLGQRDEGDFSGRAYQGIHLIEKATISYQSWGNLGVGILKKLPSRRELKGSDIFRNRND